MSDRRAAQLDNGSFAITIAHHNGDEAIPKSKHDTPSTACQRAVSKSLEKAARKRDLSVGVGVVAQCRMEKPLS